MISQGCGFLLWFTLASFAQTLFPSGLTRFAGADTSTLIGDNGPAYNAVFNNAAGLARDAAGQFYVAESTRIRKIDTRGIVTTVASALTRPTALALDGKGNLDFIDNNRTIGRLAADGSITAIAGNGSTAYNGEGVAALSAGMAPNALAFDAAGQLYFTDFVNARVRVIRADGNVYPVAGTNSAGYAGEGGPAALAQLFQPFALAFDAAGNLFVTDALRVLRIDPHGILTRVAGDPSLSSVLPTEEVTALRTVVYGGFIAPGAANDLFVASPNVRHITADGVIHGYAGLDYGSDPVAHPCGDARTSIVVVKAMVTGADGTVYVLNAAPNPAMTKLQSIAGGKIVTIAGDGPNLFSGDGGPAGQATFAAPSAIAFDARGTLYIADTNNNRVRAIDASGTVRTVAGDGGPTYDQDPACMADQDSFLRSPRGLWVDAGGNVLVADTGKNRIRKIAPDGTAGTIADSLNQPVGIAADNSGNIFIGDAGSRRVLKFDRQGNITTVANVAPTGALSFTTAGDLLIPAGVEVDRLTPGGMLLPASGLAEQDTNNLHVAAVNSATAAVVDRAGSLYVADSAKAVIQRTSFHCAITADGHAQLSQPSALAFDPAGNLYVADPGTGAIWKALPTTVAANETPTPFLAPARPVQNVAPSLLPPPPFSPDPFHPFPPNIQEAIAPGEMVRFNGACIGPPDPVNASLDASGKLPTTLGGATLLIGGAPVPLISVQQGSIVGVAPAGLATVGSPRIIQLGYRGQGVSASVPVQTANPALFTVGFQPSGPVLALNADGSLNSASHPAAKGSVVSLWGSGFGPADPALPDGVLAPSEPLSRLVLRVTATIGGANADVLFAGAAPGFAGLTQINLRVPESVSGQGAAQIVLNAGAVALNQNTVTIFVQ